MRHAISSAGALLVSTLVLAGLGCGGRHDAATDSVPATTPTLPPPGTPLTYGNFCAACHGVRGEGNATLRTPSIGGLPEWYVRQELEKFRNGQRGGDARDADGQRMQAIARLIPAEVIGDLAATVAAMGRHPTIDTFGGDARRGLTVYHEYCAACHRYNGSGELAFRSAPLTGLQDWYLLAQLAKFRAGIRGSHPQDEDGAKMRLVTSSLDENHDRDVVAYITVLAARNP
jgi:cytochrome c553